MEWTKLPFGQCIVCCPAGLRAICKFRIPYGYPYYSVWVLPYVLRVTRYSHLLQPQIGQTGTQYIQYTFEPPGVAGLFKSVLCIVLQTTYKH